MFARRLGRFSDNEAYVSSVAASLPRSMHAVLLAGAGHHLNFISLVQLALPSPPSGNKTQPLQADVCCL